MNYEFLKDVIGSPWQIEPRTLNSLYPIFKAMISGISLESSPEPQNHIPYFINADLRKPGCEDDDCGDDEDDDDEDDMENDLPDNDLENPKTIHVLPIRSVLTKHDQNCGPVGTRTLGNRLIEADRDRNVLGHILLIESGGGQASAVPELSEAIQKCSKPLVVWIDGCACSAAYYIATYCNEIIASRPMDYVGSIGTLSQFESRKSKSPENEDGVISVTIYADGSSEKNEEFETAINEFDFTLMKERILNPFNEKFQQDVITNRPQVLLEQLKGRTYYARDVIGSLIDSIGEFSTAVDRVIALANYTAPATSKQGATNQNITKSKIEMKQFPHLNSVLAVEALEATEEGAFLNEEQFTSIEERLELNQQLATERDTAVQSLETATATLGATQASLEQAYDPFNAIDPTIAAAITPEAKAEAVRTLLATPPAVAAVQNLGQNNTETDQVDWEAINNLPHNKAVDANS